MFCRLHSRNALCVLLVSLFGPVGVAATSSYESTEEGWFELGASARSKPVSHGDVAIDTHPGGSNGRSGDRLWIVSSGDTFYTISAVTTGSVNNAQAIAQYNRLLVDNRPGEGSLILVPLELLLPVRSARVKVESEIRESGFPERAYAARPDSAEQVVRQVEVDMFAGEVKVLGKVDVSRVAIGNGAVVRAEVLATGELLVIAQTAGSSSLRLWNANDTQSDYNIRVSEADPVTRVRMERMVRIRVRLVEFRKSALGKLGIDWSDGAQGPTFAAAGDAVGNNLFRPSFDEFSGLPNTVAPFSTYFGIASNITSRINFLASSGDAVTLAEPVLSAMNGGSASFLAGGEVPYPTVGANGQTTVDFKEYGIKLNVSPLIDSAGNVRTSVETEISQLDPAVSVQGAPGLLTRRAQTEINVRSGETIVISGLLSADNSKDVDRIPGIGRLPVIGALFRSQNTRNSVSELVIFVTPEVVEPGSTVLAERDQSLFDEVSERLDTSRTLLPLMD